MPRWAFHLVALELEVHSWEWRTLALTRRPKTSQLMKPAIAVQEHTDSQEPSQFLDLCGPICFTSVLCPGQHSND